MAMLSPSSTVKSTPSRIRTSPSGPVTCLPTARTMMAAVAVVG